VAAAVFAVVLALVVRDREAIEAGARRVARAFLPALAGLLVVAGLPLAIQFLGPLRVAGRLQDTARFSTDLLNLVLPTRYQLLGPRRRRGSRTSSAGCTTRRRRTSACRCW
jgi:hypothetical protein